MTLDPVANRVLGSPGECAWGGAASTFFFVDPAEELTVLFFTQLLPSSTYPHQATPAAARLPGARRLTRRLSRSGVPLSLVPINGRYLLASGWYEGASSLIDFTRPRRPREIAFYDAQSGIPANTWSTYWYRDDIFASDRQRPTTRGLDIFHVATRRRTRAFDLRHEIPQERRLRCRLRVRPRRLREGERLRWAGFRGHRDCWLFDLGGRSGRLEPWGV